MTSICDTILNCVKTKIPEGSLFQIEDVRNLFSKSSSYAISSFNLNWPEARRILEAEKIIEFLGQSICRGSYVAKPDTYGVGLHTFLKCTRNHEEELVDRMKTSNPLTGEKYFSLSALEWKDLFYLVQQKNPTLIEIINKESRREYFKQRLQSATAKLYLDVDKVRKEILTAQEKLEKLKDEIESYKNLKEEILEAERKMTFAYFFLKENEKQ